MTFTETIDDATSFKGDLVDVPSDVAGLIQALVAQRQYTLALYAELPQEYWNACKFPFLATVNPPLWELAHIAWFQEYFALRWRADDENGLKRPSSLEVADQLFDSRRVAHWTRWQMHYPSKSTCFDYMQRVLDDTIVAIEASIADDRYGFQLALLHEDMHGEAMSMTLTSLGLSLPPVVRRRSKLVSHVVSRRGIRIAGGVVPMGASARAFSFDNEKPALLVRLEPFELDERVVSAAEFAAFRVSGAYHDPRFWSAEGNAWRELGPRTDRPGRDIGESDEYAAMHMNYFEADAYCRWVNRRLPTEAEWEYSAVSSDEFLSSTGHVWEWTASSFLPYPGFRAERYREYSQASFHSPQLPCQVLRGGSFATHSRLKYPQYRNFFAPARNDMFCGFRTCAIR